MSDGSTQSEPAGGTVLHLTGALAGSYDGRSGLHVAEQARAAGHVVDAPQQPLHDVTVAFTIHGPADTAAGIVRELTEHLAILDAVHGLTTSTAERAPL